MEWGSPLASAIAPDVFRDCDSCDCLGTRDTLFDSRGPSSSSLLRVKSMVALCVRLLPDDDFAVLVIDGSREEIVGVLDDGVGKFALFRAPCSLISITSPSASSECVA